MNEGKQDEDTQFKLAPLIMQTYIYRLPNN